MYISIQTIPKSTAKINIVSGEIYKITVNLFCLWSPENLFRGLQIVVGFYLDLPAIYLVPKRM